MVLGYFVFIFLFWKFGGILVNGHYDYFGGFEIILIIRSFDRGDILLILEVQKYFSYFRGLRVFWSF
jgi:hypothetical protein